MEDRRAEDTLRAVGHPPHACTHPRPSLPQPSVRLSAFSPPRCPCCLPYRCCAFCARPEPTCPAPTASATRCCTTAAGTWGCPRCRRWSRTTRSGRVCGVLAGHAPSKRVGTFGRRLHTRHAGSHLRSRFSFPQRPCCGRQVRVNVRGHRGMTPLHHAAQRGRAEVVRWLLGKVGRARLHAYMESMTLCV